VTAARRGRLEGATALIMAEPKDPKACSDCMLIRRVYCSDADSKEPNRRHSVIATMVAHSKA
jgi:hypothetical protein